MIGKGAEGGVQSMIWDNISSAEHLNQKLLHCGRFGLGNDGYINQ